MASSICAACGNANREDARFCAACGRPLLARCRSCGAELSPAARFCEACGTPVADGAAASPEAALKVVSVVMSDIAGSTALHESLDAEAVRVVMVRFYEVMRAAVERHGGRVEKFIGDAVVAVFGTPAVREDDGLRAVRCAAAMVADLEVLNDELERGWGVRLAIRTGVNTGELVISAEGILVGDTLNTAARLEQTAEPGEVLVGEATRRLVRHDVQLEPLAPLALKGKAEPVRAWRLVSAAAGPDEAAGTRAEAPLVGRADELGRLQRALSLAVAGRECRLVTVIGSPGLGKSRLAREFSAVASGQARVLVGHCEPSGEGITFLPVAEVLRGAAGIGEADPPAEVRDKLLALVAEDPERDEVAARAASLLGAGDPASPEEAFWSVRRVLESLARRGPLVVVLDDLHWGQPMFLDLVEHLVEWVRDAPVLLVALARPELREQREAVAAAGRRATDVIELAPLETSESRALVDGLLGAVDLGAGLLERILGTTDGNPLFLSELLRMLVDQGSIAQENEVWVACGGAEAVQVPPTIQALLTGRIERLRPDERTVVERAAVIGKQFYRGAVADLVAPPVRSGIDSHLEALRRKDMVEPEGTYWIDEPVYRFHHVLVRDAAYHLLLKEARAELHERFADWLELKVGELAGEHEEVVAYHLEQAHEYRCQLGPLDERGRALGARAAARLVSAGRRALAREDLAAAANLLRRALDRAAADDADTVWDLAEALLSAGDTGGAGEAVGRLTALASAEDPRLRARADVLAGQLAILTGSERLEAVLERVGAAGAALATAGDGRGEAKAHHVIALAHAQLGRVAAVESALEHALLAARRVEDRRRITAVLAAAPRAALWGPSPVVRASGRCLDVVRILRMTPGNRHVEAIALRCQAVLEAMRGRPEAARDIIEAARVRLEELGLTLELHEHATHAGIVELLAGAPEAAEALLRGAREGFETLGVDSGAAQASALLARALVDQGRDEEAAAETRFAEQRAGGDLKATITWCGVRAEALARGGRHEEALGLARRAVELAEPTDALADKADAAMALARVLRTAGDEVQARVAALAASELYAAKDHAVGVARARELAGGGEAATARVLAVGASAATLGERAPERLFAEFQRRADARDYEGMSALMAEDWSQIDHRPLGWEPVHGREQADAIVHSAFGASRNVRFEFDEVLACDERVIAMRKAWRGRGVRAGELEVEVGAVAVVEGGLWVSDDLYEPDDRAAMIARYAELGGGLAALGDRPPERFLATYARALASRDLEALAALFTEDYASRDHRSVSLYDVRGREQFVEVLRSLLAIASSLHCEFDEVLACDDRVAAALVTFEGAALDGGGAFEVNVGMVLAVDAGRAVSVDLYEPRDRAAMLERYTELGGRRRVLGERPPERHYREFVRRWAARDVDGMAELVAEDWVSVDHRALGWEERRGREGAREVFRSVVAMSPDLRLEVDEVLAVDERVIALRLGFRGHGGEGSGQVEYLVGYVTVVEDGRAVRSDQYDYGDDRAMLARYAELAGGQGPLGDRPPERYYREFARRWAARDVERMAELVSEEWASVDHRAVGWDAQRGRDGARALFASVFSVSPDVRFEIDDVLACDERVIAMRVGYRGHAGEAEGEGEGELVVGGVAVVEDGLGVSLDYYDYDDDAAMLARYAELGGGLGPLGDRPPERHYREFARRWAARDVDALVEGYTEDFVWVDHRALGWEEQRGSEGARAMFESAFSVSPDVRFEIDEVLACDELVIAMRVGFRGHAGDGAGEFEGLFGGVAVIEDGRVVSLDYYDYDDDAAMLARYAELCGRRDAPPPDERDG